MDYTCRVHVIAQHDISFAIAHSDCLARLRIDLEHARIARAPDDLRVRASLSFCQVVSAFNSEVDLASEVKLDG